MTASLYAQPAGAPSSALSWRGTQTSQTPLLSRSSWRKMQDPKFSELREQRAGTKQIKGWAPSQTLGTRRVLATATAAHPPCTHPGCPPTPDTCSHGVPHKRPEPTGYPEDKAQVQMQKGFWSDDEIRERAKATRAPEKGIWSPQAWSPLSCPLLPTTPASDPCSPLLGKQMTTSYPVP